MAIGDQPPPRIPSRVRPKRGEKGSITFRGRLIVSRHGRPDGTHRQRTLPNNRYGCSGNRAANTGRPKGSRKAGPQDRELLPDGPRITGPDAGLATGLERALTWAGEPLKRSGSRRRNRRAS